MNAQPVRVSQHGARLEDRAVSVSANHVTFFGGHSVGEDRIVATLRKLDLLSDEAAAMVPNWILHGMLPDSAQLSEPFLWSLALEHAAALRFQVQRNGEVVTVSAKRGDETFQVSVSPWAVFLPGGKVEPFSGPLSSCLRTGCRRLYQILNTRAAFSVAS